MLSDLLNILLSRRGIVGAAEREKFLRPNYGRDIYDPFRLRGMERAVARIFQAVNGNEKIIIFADYDADGVPGAVLLAEFFRKINFANFEVYIPNRQTEDYGLSAKTIREFAAGGAKLIITVDCGITNVAEIKLADVLGLEVIVTDHHLPPPAGAEQAPAYAVINPKQEADEYPDKMLCGAAVAFKLLQGLVRRIPLDHQQVKALVPNWEKTLLDLVAIATISDRVPLVGENRALAFFGLMILRQTRRPGLLALLAAAGLDQVSLNEDDIGFMIGPRLNSAGRMSHASEAFSLLSTTDPVEAQTLADHLEKQNVERKKSVEKILAAVESRLAGKELPALIVVGDRAWSPGVLGLGASRLAEQKYRRPVCVWGANGGASAGEDVSVKGSCRSDGTVNVVELMRLAEENAGGLFENFGGHVAAGGFSLRPERLPELENRLLAAYLKAPKLSPPAEKEADANLSLDDLDEAWRAVEQLAPFGIGNPKPLFRFPDLSIVRIKTFGNGGLHLELTFEKSNSEAVCAVGFFTGVSKFPGVTLSPGARINLLATLEKSYFKRAAKLRLRLVDIKPFDCERQGIFVLK